VLKLLNIHLDDVKLSELFYKIDKNNNGLIEYPEWVETAG
jgi:Ca2+-binding EF-hand superfamily protein